MYFKNINIPKCTDSKEYYARTKPHTEMSNDNKQFIVLPNMIS